MRLLSLCLWIGALAQEPVARFHHVHLNSTDPEAAVRFYTAKFDCEAARFGGRPAVWAQKSWLLFNKVKTPPPAETDSPIWHIGWGAEDMAATYQKHLESGTRFHTPLTDISDLANFKGFYFAYVDGPDHALIELNTARHHHFGHLHLFSADPHAAGDWYARHLGVRVRKSASREPRYYRGFQVGPSASFTIDNVNVILYPAGYRKHQRFRSSRGTVFDHIAFSVDRLELHLEALCKEGVRVLEKPKRIPGTRQRAVLVEGPDLAAIEFVEGHAARP